MPNANLMTCFVVESSFFRLTSSLSVTMFGVRFYELITSTSPHRPSLERVLASRCLYIGSAPKENRGKKKRLSEEKAVGDMFFGGGGKGGERGREGRGGGARGAGGGAHVRACTRRLTCPQLLPNVNELSRFIERGTSSCLALKDQRSLREESVQWSYFFPCTSSLLPDSQ
jgi:hypothetical protein